MKAIPRHEQYARIELRGSELGHVAPALVIERALFDRNRELLLITARALKFSWQTTMALLFLGAKEHRITAGELTTFERDFNRLNVETSRSVLKFYQSRKNAGSTDSDLKRKPALAVN